MISILVYWAVYCVLYTEELQDSLTLESRRLPRRSPYQKDQLHKKKRTGNPEPCSTGDYNSISVRNLVTTPSYPYFTATKQQRIESSLPEEDPCVDQDIVLVSGWLLHDALVRRVESKGGGRGPVSHKVHPQKLQQGQVLGSACNLVRCALRN